MTTITPPTNTLKQDALVISLVGFAHGISHFYHLILASLFPFLKIAFDLSYAELGLLMTVFFVVSSVGQALAGFVVDRFGALIVLLLGMACLSVAAVVLAFAPSYAVLLLGSMLAGVGNSVFHPSDFTILNKRVSTARLGHAFSVHGISGNLGWASAPVFLVGIAGAFDWRVALLAASVLPALMLAVLLVYRDVLQPADAALVVSDKRAKAVGADNSVLGFMRLPAVWMCFGFFFLIAMALGGIQSFASSSLRELYGMSLAWATSAYTAYMLASALGMLWGGYLASKTTQHDRTITLAFTTAGALSLLVATGLPSAWLAVVLMAAIGFGSGVAGPSRDLLIRAAAPKNATGRVYGVVYSGLDTGMACAPLLFGALMDAHHPSWLFVAIGGFQVLAILTAVNVGSSTRARVIAG